MKKRILAIIMIMAMCLALCACGGSREEKAKEYLKEEVISTYLPRQLVTECYGKNIEVTDFDVANMTENSEYEFTPSSDMSADDKKKLDDTYMNFYDITGTYTGFNKKTGENLQGEWKGTYFIAEYKGEYLINLASFTAD